jgi:hypothetical protein
MEEEGNADIGAIEDRGFTMGGPCYALGVIMIHD